MQMASIRLANPEKAIARFSSISSGIRVRFGIGVRDQLQAKDDGRKIAPIPSMLRCMHLPCPE